MAKLKVRVRGIIYSNGKLLAQKLVHNQMNAEKDFWCTPGGGLEENEALIDGLRREIIEETGIEPKIGKLLFIQQLVFEGNEQLELFFHIENTSDYNDIDLASTSHGLKEIRLIEFIDPKKSWLLPDFLQKIDIQDYLDNNKEVLLANYLN